MAPPNFARLDTNRPEISRLVAAMLQARDAVSRRSWSHPQEHASEEWWAYGRLVVERPRYTLDELWARWVGL
jgi:hypothetical protein